MITYKIKIMDIQIEKLAAIQHEIWSHWMKYLFSLTKTAYDKDGNCIGLAIPHKSASHWGRQMNTMYEDLTEDEKQSDRDQVYKFNDLVFGERAKTILKGLDEVVAGGRPLDIGEISALAESLHYAIYGEARAKPKKAPNDTPQSEYTKDQWEQSGWVFDSLPLSNRNVLLLLHTNEKIEAHHYHNMIYRDRAGVKIHNTSIKAWKYTTKSVKGDVVADSPNGQSYVRQGKKGVWVSLNKQVPPPFTNIDLLGFDDKPMMSFQFNQGTWFEKGNYIVPHEKVKAWRLNKEE